MKISIIVPVYNAEDRLDKCIQSILNQTFQDFELILINDGSKDRTLSICESYARNESRIVVISQENAGPSAARNRGIDVARGKYIVFIDSDDHVAPEYLESFFRLDNNPDKTLVQQGYVRLYYNGEEKIFNYPLKIYDKSSFSDLFLSNELIKRLPFPWAKLYSTEIIQEKHIRFEEDIKYGEDLIFLLDYLKYVKTFIFINTNYYYYEYNEQSLTNSLHSLESALIRMEIVKSKLDEIASIFHLNKTVISYNNSYIVNYVIQALNSNYKSFTINGFKERINFIKATRNSNFYSVIEKDYSPSRLIDKIFKYLFDNRLYILLDTFLYGRFRASKILR